MRRDECIEVALSIGRRIAAGALWDGAACTWEIAAYHPGAGEARREAAGGHVYQGSAGIAWFLGELYRATGDAAVRRAAAGGLRHALDEAAGYPPVSFAFHGGRVGNAWVAARLARALGRPELAREAGALLAPLAGHEHLDPGLDWIAGAAGAIPALLDLAAELPALGAPAPDLPGMAERLGDRLLASAWREPGGWSWGTVGPSAVRNLTGLAHGTSGIALALLELARATGAGRFRFAADMALLYERRWFDPRRSNWPDLRHRELNSLVYSGDPEAPRRAAATGDLPPFEPSYLTAWCHGAPGIGLARVRGFELTGDPVLRREAEAALAGTLPSLRTPPEIGFSLCHGVAGNCELPLAVAAALGDEAATAPCLEAARYGRDTFERPGSPWPCGTVGGVSDPSLLLGEAGIGSFYLRLGDPETPSILQPRPPLAAAGAEDGGGERLAAEWVEECFGTTRAALDLLAPPPAARAGIGSAAASGPGTPLSPVSPVEQTFRDLQRRIGALTGEARALAEDAFAVDRARHTVAAADYDLTQDYLRGLLRPAADAVDWELARLAPAPGLRVVTTARDWSRAGGGELPEPAETSWLVGRLEGRALVRRLRPLAAAALAALEPPATLPEAVARVARWSGLDREAVAGALRQQIEQMVRAGTVELAELAPAAGASSLHHEVEKGVAASDPYPATERSST